MTTYDEIDYLPHLDTEDPVGREIVRINDLRRQIDELKLEKDILSERVTKQLEADGVRTVGVATPQGETLRATVTKTPSRKVNLVQLKEVNEPLYYKITKPTLDTEALNREINKGSFTEQEIHLISISYSKPFIRFSEVNTLEDE
jgi:hypothetical protein